MKGEHVSSKEVSGNMNIAEKAPIRTLKLFTNLSLPTSVSSSFTLPIQQPFCFVQHPIFYQAGM